MLKFNEQFSIRRQGGKKVGGGERKGKRLCLDVNTGEKDESCSAFSLYRRDAYNDAYLNYKSGHYLPNESNIN